MIDKTYCDNDDFTMHIPLGSISSALKVDFDDIEDTKHEYDSECRSQVWNALHAICKDLLYEWNRHELIAGGRTLSNKTSAQAGKLYDSSWNQHDSHHL